MHDQARTDLPIPFRYLEPTLYSGLLDDPLLLLHNRSDGSNLLFDCGQIHHLAKRAVKAVEQIFISHAHMDHFMGLASLARNILVSTKTVNLYGPPDLSVRLENLLAGFDWNLCENFWCSFRVMEIHENTMRTFLLPGPQGFRRQSGDVLPQSGNTIFSNNQITIRAAACDHKIPSLIFRIDERPAFAIDENKIRQEGLVRGDWLRELNSRYNRRELESGPLTVLLSGDKEERIDDAASLYRRICAEQAPLSIGYMTDVGWTGKNRAVITSLFNGINMLVTECTYNSDNVDKARASYHLCTHDLNELMAALEPDYVIPVHVSKSNLNDTGRIFSELQPPAGTTVLRLPDHIAPRPFLPGEIPLLKKF